MGRCEPCKNLKAEVGVLRRCFRLRRRSWTLGPASAEVWATAQDRVEPRSRSRAPIDAAPLLKQDARTTVQAHMEKITENYPVMLRQVNLVEGGVTLEIVVGYDHSSSGVGYFPYVARATSGISRDGI